MAGALTARAPLTPLWRSRSGARLGVGCRSPNGAIARSRTGVAFGAGSASGATPGVAAFGTRRSLGALWPAAACAVSPSATLAACGAGVSGGWRGRGHRGTGGSLRCLRRAGGHRLPAEQTLEPSEETGLPAYGTGGRQRRGERGGQRCRCGSHGWCRRGHGPFGLGGRHRRRAVGQHALDQGLLPVGALLAATRHQRHLLGDVGQLVAGVQVVQARVVVLEPLQFVVRRLQRLVGNQQHADALLELDFGDFDTLFVEQEAGHLHRHLHQHSGGVVLEGLFLDDAQDLQRRRLGVADVARAAAARAGDGGPLGQRRAQALAAHLQQAKLADRRELHARAVLPQRFTQAVFHLAPVFAVLHVDEVDHDQAAQVAQPRLARHLVGRFQVGAQCGLLDVAALDGARRVDVNGHQRLGLVDDDGPTRGQGDGAAVGGLDLVLDLEARKQRRVVAVALDAVDIFWHHVGHEALGLLENVVGVDQDLTDVAVEIITDGTDDQRRFLVDQFGLGQGLGRALDGIP